MAAMGADVSEATTIAALLVGFCAGCVFTGVLSRAVAEEAARAVLEARREVSRLRKGMGE